jgi:hypothetical protein
MIVRVVKHLMVCNNKDLYGFTYGRIYKFIDDPDIYDTGYNWVINDKGVIKATPLSSFVTVDQFKKIVRNRNMALAALSRSEFYD